jgi:hypothetical protein
VTQVTRIGYLSNWVILKFLHLTSLLASAKMVRKSAVPVPESPITQSRIYTITRFLNGVSLEEINQLDNEDEHYQQFQHKGTRLVELLDHEPVKVFCRL